MPNTSVEGWLSIEAVFAAHSLAAIQKDSVIRRVGDKKGGSTNLAGATESTNFQSTRATSTTFRATCLLTSTYPLSQAR